MNPSVKPIHTPSPLDKQPKEEKLPQKRFSLKSEEKEEEKKKDLPSIFECAIAPPLPPLAWNPLEMPSLDGVAPVIVELVEQITYQESNGIETTTLLLGEGTELAGCEVTIVRYDTAPSSFQITFAVAAQQADLITAHLPFIQKRLEKRLPKQEFRVGKSLLREEAQKK